MSRIDAPALITRSTCVLAAALVCLATTGRATGAKFYAAAQCAGGEIDSAADCKAAAAAVGKSYSARKYSSTSYPKGCFVSGTTAYLNTHSRGRTSASSSYSALCSGTAEIGESGTDDDLGDGEIAGIVIGVLAFVAIVAITLHRERMEDDAIRAARWT